ILSMRIIASVNLLTFIFNDPATSAIYTLSLHDALPICMRNEATRGSKSISALAPAAIANLQVVLPHRKAQLTRTALKYAARTTRSEEHTSELQSRGHLVCRLLLEKKKKIQNNYS